MKRIKKLDLSVRQWTINSFINDSIPWWQGLAELIDNALDAAATHIRIIFKPDEVSVVDNGVGCPDLEKLLGIGERESHPTTAMGMHGIGGKAAAASLGRLYKVRTVRSGVVRMATVDWDLMRRQAEWNSEEEDTKEQDGTTVTIVGLCKKPSVKNVTRNLEYTYAPALQDGTQITIEEDGEAWDLEAWEAPSIKDPIQVTDSSDGLGYVMHFGIVDSHDGEPFSFTHAGRILCSNSEPCGEYCTGNRFHGRVTITGKWPLLRFKTGIKEGTAREWLYESIYNSCSDVMRTLHEEGEIVELDEIAADLESIFGIKRRRPSRPGETGKDGAITPKGTIRTVEQAAEVHPQAGTARKRQKIRGFHIRYLPLPEDIIGKVDINAKRVLIKLNQDHNICSEARKNKDKKTIRSICSALLASEFTSGPRQSEFTRKLFGEDGEGSTDDGKTFEQVFTMLMEKIVCGDAKEAQNAA